jgi:hypothetical protein
MRTDFCGARLPPSARGERRRESLCYRSPMLPQQSCPHRRVRLIAKDQDAEYVECLDCGALLEKEEITEQSGFNESLSDA